MPLSTEMHCNCNVIKLLAFGRQTYSKAENLIYRICKANEKIEKKVDNYIIALLQQRGRCTQEDEPERKTRVDFLRYEYKLKNSFEMHLSSRRIVIIGWMEKQCVVGRSPIHLFHGKFRHPWQRINCANFGTGGERFCFPRLRTTLITLVLYLPRWMACEFPVRPSSLQTRFEIYGHSSLYSSVFLISCINLVLGLYILLVFLCNLFIIPLLCFVSSSTSTVSTFTMHYGQQHMRVRQSLKKILLLPVHLGVESWEFETDSMRFFCYF